MGSFKGHALPGSFFLVFGIWWTGKYSLWYATRRNKNIGSSRLASRALQRRLEIIESAVVLFFSVVGASILPGVNVQCKIFKGAPVLKEAHLTVRFIFSKQVC